MVLKFDNSVRHVPDANEVGEDTDPEQFDLVLCDECDDSSHSENGYQIYQIVRATRDHGRGRRGPRHADYLAHPLSAMYKRFNVLVQRDLNSKAYHQTDDEIPVGRKLVLRKVPPRHQCQNREINAK